jgi:peptidoglycan/xylan/chitin deacetylase (PgdA/CDA1 family)
MTTRTSPTPPAEAPAQVRPAVHVTTSWDDGHVLDVRMAELLSRHGLPGTFYVAPRNCELRPAERLGEEATRQLAGDFEIGGHTLYHLRLGHLPADEAEREVVTGKQALEQTIGAPVTSFCYPGGVYGPEHPPMVARAGFTTARTVERWVSHATPLFETATTMHGYRHLVDGPPILRFAGGDPRLAARLYLNWDELAIRLFDRVMAEGGVYHLWGHSWEIDANGDWGRLDRVMAHIAGHEGVSYLDNTELARRFHA